MGGEEGLKCQQRGSQICCPVNRLVCADLVHYFLFSSFHRKCAMISAHYGLSDVFDNLIISLCKFTALSSEVSLQRGERTMTSTTLEFSSSLKQQYLLILVIIVSVGIYQPLPRVSGGGNGKCVVKWDFHRTDSQNALM